LPLVAVVDEDGDGVRWGATLDPAPHYLADGVQLGGQRIDLLHPWNRSIGVMTPTLSSSAAAASRQRVSL